MLNIVKNNPSTSSRAVGFAFGVNHATILRSLNEDRMYPYHLQRVQENYPDQSLMIIFHVSNLHVHIYNRLQTTKPS